MARVPGHPNINLRLLDYQAGDGDCWRVRTWRPDGYAQVGRRGETLAHRIAWAVANEQPVPPGHDVHHRCETRNCVNPAHLELLTRAEHSALHHPPTDTARPPGGECRHGHPWNQTAHLTTQGRWICLICQRHAGRRHDAKRRPKNQTSPRSRRTEG